MTTLKEDFEKWWASSGALTSKAIAWEAWQASREAIEIDLPMHFDKYESGEGMYFADEIDKAIEMAGIKVKS